MRYPRAPITEAVIELRYARPQEQALAERAAASVAEGYFYNEIEQAVNVEVDINEQAKVRTAWEGRKLSSLDRADIVIFRRGAFVCSRLAPYIGWEEFFPRVRAMWAAWRKAAGGPTEISRVGIRYINRIDVPCREGELINAEHYLSYIPRSPASFAAMTGYLIQSNRPIGQDDCHVTIQSSTIVPSLLINTVSLGLDLDVYREVNIPKRDDELWSLVERMRGHKNSIFEACITDRARELFR